MSLLVVEDDRPLRNLLEAIFKRKDIEVQAVSRGDEALSLIAATPRHYRAIVLDLMLPGMTGLEVLQRLATFRPEVLNRIIVLTAVSTAALGKLTSTHALWAVMRKPFDLAQLQSTVLACLAAHEPSLSSHSADFSRWFSNRVKDFGARAALAAIAVEGTLHVRGAHGLAVAVANSVFPLDLARRYPLTDAFANRQPLCFASVADARNVYSELLPVWDASRSIAAFPLLNNEAAFGAIGICFDQSWAFDAGQRDAFVLLASECATHLTQLDERF